MERRTSPHDPPRWAQWGVLLASIALLWHSLGDHGIYPPDEGRYAAVSGWMAEHGEWLAPRIRDQLHVTKPPLTYWAQAACIRAFGQCEFAVRAPSALAASMLLVSVFWFTRRACGALAATLAVGILAAMPGTQLIGRLAITDAMLALWWWLAICTAWLALGDGPARCSAPGPARDPASPDAPGARRPITAWTAAFWAACALVGLTKGPLLLAPVAIVGAWLLLAGRLRDARLLAPAVGLPLAVAPLALVAWGFWTANPERAAEIWRFEFVDRFTGGAHDDPWWVILVAFVAGCFPATAMLTLPWFNLSPGAAWRSLRAGDLCALLVLAVVLPIIGFTLLSGKSPTYIFPAAAPTAVLVAMMLARWVDGTVSDLPPGRTAPDVRWTTGIAMTAIAATVITLAIVAIVRGRAPEWAPGWTLLWMTVPLLPAVVASWIAIAWWPRVELRLLALGAAFAAIVALWLGAHAAEDRALNAMSTRAVAAAVVELDRPVAIYALRNLGIDWHAGRWIDFAATPQELADWVQAHPTGVVVTGERDLSALSRAEDPVAARLVPGRSFDAWPMKKVVFCEIAR